MTCAACGLTLCSHNDFIYAGQRTDIQSGFRSLSGAGRAGALSPYCDHDDGCASPVSVSRSFHGPINGNDSETVSVELDGGHFLIDRVEWERLQHLPWRLLVYGNTKIVMRQIGHRKTVKNIAIYHDILRIRPSRKTPVDHINGDRLDNRKINLRICTPSQNSMNRAPNRGKLIPYKGVHQKYKNGFFARIFVGGEQIIIGPYSNPEEAALAYDAAASKHFGEFAWLNQLHFKTLTQYVEHNLGAR